MPSRSIGSLDLRPVGLGCMNLSHVYGNRPSEKEASDLLNQSLDLGCNHLDTAALYGFGANEKLIGDALKSRRQDYMLASKCGMTGVNGKKKIDGSPVFLRQTLEQSLRNLKTEVIDLYYLHRWDKSIPIEDSIGEMSRFVEEGKVQYIGLSEVSADTIKKAHAVHPISAVQSEYSLWSRNVEIAALPYCKELGIAFIAFSPVARGFLTEKFEDGLVLEPQDLRNKMPRFNAEHWPTNRALQLKYLELAKCLDLPPAQLALAWVLAQGDNIHVIPGTTSVEHLKDNMGSDDKVLSPSILQALSSLVNQDSVSGPRYGALTQIEIDTEEFKE